MPQEIAEEADWRQVAEEDGKEAAALRERLQNLTSLGMWNVPWTACRPGNTRKTWKRKDSVQELPQDYQRTRHSAGSVSDTSSLIPDIFPPETKM